MPAGSGIEFVTATYMPGCFFYASFLHALVLSSTDTVPSLRSFDVTFLLVVFISGLGNGDKHTKLKFDT